MPKRQNDNLILPIFILVTIALGITEAIIGRQIDELENNSELNVHYKNVGIAAKSFLAFTLLFLVLEFLQSRREYYTVDLSYLEANRNRGYRVTPIDELPFQEYINAREKDMRFQEFIDELRTNKTRYATEVDV